jgi:phenylalanine-4-hydroxylase
MAAVRDIPAHLRELVVTQAYDEYTAEDQAVWRFAVQHTRQRLVHTAHAAYRSGFDAAGISADRIPRIAEMNDKLASIGWSAVCVDGFIPPRAFQAFQAHRILPIAADIRTRGHLTYTPAPDIIHEAAGHAPFLANASYADYLMRIGEVGGRAFSTPADQTIYEAIFALSEVKESTASTPEQVARAEQRLERAVTTQGEPSEAALLARLYWWTVEYGLVGELSQPKLYGAGLLSSIGEGYFCEDPAVHKLPLSEACIDVAYDITRPQPQLFVARDFEHLSEVLERVAGGLSQSRGGRPGLRAALRSEEPATLVLDTSERIAGTVLAVHEDRAGGTLVELDEERVLALTIRDESLQQRYPGKTLLHAERVVSASAGGIDRASVSMRPPSMRVPKPRARDAAALEVLSMFERTRDAFGEPPGRDAVALAETIAKRLDDAYPEEWLLRYELLSGLVHASGASDAHSRSLQAKLVRDLERLEIRYAHREPIATGLTRLRSRMGGDPGRAERS